MSEDYVGGLLSPSGVRAKALSRKRGIINAKQRRVLFHFSPLLITNSKLLIIFDSSYYIEHSDNYSRPEQGGREGVYDIQQ